MGTLGDRVRIGAGSVVLRDVPSDCTVVGIPGRIIRNGTRSMEATQDRENLPDVEAEVISFSGVAELMYDIAIEKKVGEEQ